MVLCSVGGLNCFLVLIVVHRELQTEMAEESSTTSHLSVAMTTDDADNTQTATGNTMTSSSSSDAQFYFRCTVVVMGVLGTAGNGLILYALVKAKQHKKRPLIVNQNVLDVFQSFFLVVSYVVQLCNIYYTGALGYWLCIALHYEVFTAYGFYGSRVNIAAIAVERYLKVVHHAWAKTKLRPWMTYLAIAFSWLLGVVVETPLLLRYSTVKDGVCYDYHSSADSLILIVLIIWYLLSFYLIILIIFIFCYGRILVAIRRQARVMAAHSAAGPSTSHTQQFNQIQTNVIKTMIFVSALYIICHLLHVALYVDLLVGPIMPFGSVWNASRIIEFLYVTANPFIYAFKFDPVKNVLKGMIPSRMAVCFNHVVHVVTTRGNRSTTAPNDQELADMSTRE